MDVVSVVRSLRQEAESVDERRLLVLSGDRTTGYDTLESILDECSVPITETTLLGPEDRLRCEQIDQANADRLLGTTREILIIDTHETLRPNALGQVVGAVSGGGLLILLTPELNTWADEPNAYDESLAVPPFSLAEVTGNFRSRLVETLRVHRGIAIIDIDQQRLCADGLTDPSPRRTSDPPEPPVDHRFPARAYDVCLTQDQVQSVAALESLFERDRAVILKADRGRGKSSAAGLAAGCFAANGEDVLVIAPDRRNATPIFERARDIVDSLDCPNAPHSTTVSDAEHGQSSGEHGHSPGEHEHSLDYRIDRSAGGCVRFAVPSSADPTTVCSDGIDPTAADVLIVDEAAALPVRVLESLLGADRIAFATTVHGYEGSGRGFDVRFRAHLGESDHEVIETTLVEPIRYAAGDPIETWAFRALLLDARPPVLSLVEDARPSNVTYRALTPAELLANERLLRETFGSLVLAHYRTEPTDLARLLDAPNLSVRALCYDGHVVSVCLLAREGGLSTSTREAMYEGERVRGNMLPDMLTSQIRDEQAGKPSGLRVMRIATHDAVRSRGLGSLLLERVRKEFTDEIDWLGTGFGATPGLLEFWDQNGFSTVHCSTTRNDASGEYSAMMLAPISDAGRQLHDRHTRWFLNRIAAVCSDALDDMDPDVVRAVLRSTDGEIQLSLTDQEWRVVVGAAYGPGLFDVDPGPFRRLVVHYFVDDPDTIDFDTREERLLVRRVLQGTPWNQVADELDYLSSSQCMRALGDAFCPLVDHYGTDAAHAIRDRID